MAKHSYRTEDDDSFDLSRPSGLPRTLALLFGVASVTFALAYYLPLHRTHEALVSEYRALTEKTTSLERDVATARGELRALSASSAELTRERREHEAGKTEVKARAEQAVTTLKTKLGPQIASRALSVETRANGVIAVKFEGALKETRARVDVLPTAAVLLCEVATAAGSSFALRAVGAASGGGDAWDAAGSRAAAVARVLGDKCQVPANRLTTRTGPGGDSAPGTVVVELDPSSP